MGKLTAVVEYEVDAGTSIEEAASEACRIAKRNKCIVKFSFNGVPVKVYWFSNVDDVVEQYLHSVMSDVRFAVFLVNVLNDMLNQSSE